MTPYALSKATGITQTTIGYWLSSGKVPNGEMLLKLSKHFKVSIDYLLVNDISSSDVVIETDEPEDEDDDLMIAANMGGSRYDLLTDEQRAEVDRFIEFQLAEMRREEERRKKK
jgi:transcriptional regulator with XRE-family HTH domain